MARRVRLALDTNILAYAEGVNGQAHKADALALLERLRVQDIVLPAQAFGELYNVLVRKTRVPAGPARDAVLAWHETFPLIATSPSVMVAAADLAADHHFSIWDAAILAASASQGCAMLLSEDVQDGFVWGGVTVVDPFATALNPRLRTLLHDPPA